MGNWVYPSFTEFSSSVFAIMGRYIPSITCCRCGALDEVCSAGRLGAVHVRACIQQDRLSFCEHATPDDLGRRILVSKWTTFDNDMAGAV